MADAPRIVPGAPPPTPLSRAQKKKRKPAKTQDSDTVANGSVAIPDATAAALVERAPDQTDLKAGAVALELVANSEQVKPSEDGSSPKFSPIVDVLTKRIKATSKKISRIATYASTDVEKLNDDQRRTLKTLPSLEGAQKELEDIKKIIESYEAEQQHELALQRAEADRAQKAKIAEAVAASQNASATKVSDLLSLLHMQSLLSSGQHLPVALDETEATAIFSAVEVLLGEESDAKRSLVTGFMSDHGQINGLSYSRVVEIVQSYLNPPRDPTPIPEELVDDATEDVEPEPEISAPDPELPVAGAAGVVSVANSFHFMQASELDTPSDNVEQWQGIPNGADDQNESFEPHSVLKMTNGVTANGKHVAEEISAVISVEIDTPLSASANGPLLDWADADDEGGLPSLSNLQAKFGASGSATPVAETPAVKLPGSELVNGVHEDVQGPQMEDDGFLPARGGRGRGRSWRGERGNFRGGFRGGERGQYRGDRGFRGGGRGGDRGSFRGRSNGEWRGGDEHRARGRSGRGRGDRGGLHEPRDTPPS